MTAGIDPPAANGVWELFIVLALAVLGLSLAAAAAFVPWYPALAGSGLPPVVRVDAPRQPTP